MVIGVLLCPNVPEKQEKIISDIEKRTKQKVESEFTLKQDKKNKEHFQKYLQENKLSSHMRIVVKK